MCISAVPPWIVLDAMWLFWSLLVAARCQCPSPQVLLANLTAHYDALAHPGQLSGQAVPVQVMLYITSIVQMAQKDQQLVVDGYYRTQWWDERLALDRWPGCSTFVLEKEKFAGEKQIWQPAARSKAVDMRIRPPVGRN